MAVIGLLYGTVRRHARAVPTARMRQSHSLRQHANRRQAAPPEENASCKQSVSTQPRVPRRTVPNRFARVAGASVAGTTLEFYDHFIYGSAAALVFPKLFFPQSDPLTATLLSFASYGVAFVARPLGAAIFGHFGDKFGRKSVLIVTLLMMGLATFGIGLLPTYGSVGCWRRCCWCCCA